MGIRDSVGRAAVAGLVALVAFTVAREPASLEPVTYGVPGAIVRVYNECGPGGRTLVYELSATDSRAWEYDLGYDTSGYTVAAGGLVAVEGSRVTWLQHTPPAPQYARFTVAGGPCDTPVPPLVAVIKNYLSYIRKGG